MEKLRFWTEEYTVRSYEGGPGGFAHLGCLCNYLQETAGKHADHLGFGMHDLFSEGKTWMLSRLLVHIDRYPLIHESLSVKTWPRSVDRLFALRDYEMYDRSGRRVLAAVSSWLVIDLGSKRPLRPGSLRHRLTDDIEDRALAADPGKLPGAETGVFSAEITAGSSELDINRHVNSTQYVNWIVDQAKELHEGDFLCREIELNFLSECRAGDRLRVRTRENRQGDWYHSILRNGDGKEVCSARTKWEQVQGR